MSYSKFKIVPPDEALARISEYHQIPFTETPELCDGHPQHLSQGEDGTFLLVMSFHDDANEATCSLSIPLGGLTKEDFNDPLAVNAACDRAMQVGREIALLKSLAMHN